MRYCCSCTTPVPGPMKRPKSGSRTLTLPQVPDRDLASVLIRGKGNKSRRVRCGRRRSSNWLPGAGPRSERTRVPESLRPTHHTVWHPYAGGAVCGSGGEGSAVLGRQAGQSAHDSPHDGDPPAAFRSGYQHDPGWLGHVSLTTTNVYAEVDLEMKAKALANCEVEGRKEATPWKEDKGLMDFLRTL